MKNYAKIQRILKNNFEIRNSVKFIQLKYPLIRGQICWVCLVKLL